ncbi:MAG: GNAT family N-acetyltransferase [Candidatus Thorarchaeota archaeon]
MPIEIRKLHPNDEKELIDICFITGDEHLKKIFPDPYLFSLFWCLYYVWFEKENSFVAVDSTKNKVIGYIFSTYDTYSQEESFKRNIYPKIKERMKELKLKSLQTKLYAYFITNWPLTKKRKRLITEYPAHLHIDILPDYQRQGIGHRLMKTLENNLQENKVKGFHLGVGTDNIQGINFYKKYGLTLAYSDHFTSYFVKKIIDD